MHISDMNLDDYLDHMREILKEETSDAVETEEKSRYEAEEYDENSF